MFDKSSMERIINNIQEQLSIKFKCNSKANTIMWIILTYSKIGQNAGAIWFNNNNIQFWLLQLLELFWRSN